MSLAFKRLNLALKGLKFTLCSFVPLKFLCSFILPFAFKLTNSPFATQNSLYKLDLLYSWLIFERFIVVDFSLFAYKSFSVCVKFSIKKTSLWLKARNFKACYVDEGVD